MHLTDIRPGQNLSGVESNLNRNALAQETMSAERLFAVKEEMDKAEARRLQPCFVRAFFRLALDALGGTADPREAGRFEITHVPATIRERDRRLTGRNRRESEPVLKRYERICFERQALQPLDKPGLARAVLMHPGHPLMLALSDLLLEQHANLLRQGTILVDPADEGLEPTLLFLLTHEITSGNGQTLSKRLQFVRVGADGQAGFAGWAPHLDLEPLPASDRPLLDDLLAVPWIASGQETRALALAASRRPLGEPRARVAGHASSGRRHPHRARRGPDRPDGLAEAATRRGTRRCGGRDLRRRCRGPRLDRTAGDGPYYIRHPFEQEPGWGVASINYDLGSLLARAEDRLS